MFELIKASLFGTECRESISAETYAEMKKHAINVLPADVLSSLTMPEELRRAWKNDIIKALAYHTRYSHEQLQLPITVPYAILKGSAAAQYYPYPEYRIMGDIDIITRREDFETACGMLLRNGYTEDESNHEEETGRHRCFKKNGIITEIHSYFAIFTDVEKSEYLDNLIIENITPDHVLPDMINGLVLLAHIDQHIEQGIGFRQIIDWMMFADKFLPDEKWPEFCSLVKDTGLTKLAIVTTRMCEIYLGLPEREWAAEADAALCSQWMEYISSCGNFGNKQELEDRIGQNVFSHVGAPKSIFKLMQERGLLHWRGARKHALLRPFAWIYQAGRYFHRGIRRAEAPSKLLEEYRASRRRRALCDALGATQASNGIVIYKDGKYEKK